VSNDDLVSAVSEELVFDPKVDSGTIAVSADDGNVTLRGTAGSFRAKREAAAAAKRVYGVMNVDNQIDVRLLAGGAREDADLRADVLRALMLDSLVPDTIDATVDSGFVRLTGTAEWNYQRDEAETVASNVWGVVSLEDDVQLLGPEPDAEKVRHSIKKAMERNAKLDADDITVETKDHSVTLKGTVASWAERDDAVNAAWAMPGVRDVHDHLLVEY